MPLVNGPLMVGAVSAKCVVLRELLIGEERWRPPPGPVAPPRPVRCLTPLQSARECIALDSADDSAAQCIASRYPIGGALQCSNPQPATITNSGQFPTRCDVAGPHPISRPSSTARWPYGIIFAAKTGPRSCTFHRTWFHSTRRRRVLVSMSRACASLRAFHGASIGPATAPMPLAA